jgi:hypothetical protein
MSLTDDGIDAIVRNAVDGRWRKFAMIVAIALTDSSVAEDDDPNITDRIASRIAAMIDAGEFEVAGNPIQWRHSEIRRTSR